MISFPKTGTIREFQEFISTVYALVDDRQYSILDLLNQTQRFSMRALKGIRKSNVEKIKINLLIALSWLMAAANRLHIDIEDEVWVRFPARCSYCGKIPCACKAIKATTRVRFKRDNTLRPHSLAAFQKMFGEIYPASSRTLADAGVHLAEEVGEVGEAMHYYLGQHLKNKFAEVELEMADFVSCIFGVANSANIDLAKELATFFKNGCHVCHKSPCVCGFSNVGKIKT
jgi:NTP pyrophosphatase (non-canonical NTP hydrolase)